METTAAQQKRISIRNAKNTTRIWMTIKSRSDVSLETELEIFRGLKPIAWVGSIAGAFHRNILPDFTTFPSKETKRKWTLQQIYSSLLGIFYFLNLCLCTKDSFLRIKTYPATSGMRRVADFMHTVGPRLATFALFLYLEINIGKLQNLIKHLVALSKPINNQLTFWGNARQDPSNDVGSFASQVLRKYPTFCKAALICTMFNAFSENFAFDLHVFKMAYINLIDHKQLIETQVTYENYLWKGGSWEPWLPDNKYKVIFALTIQAAEKVGFIIWIFGDAITIALCQAMKNALLILKDDVQRMLTRISNERRSDFQSDENTKLSEDPTQKLFGNEAHIKENDCMSTLPLHLSISTPVKLADVYWEQIRDKYMRIIELFENMGKFVYPLILSCYLLNIFFVIDNLYMWISPSRSSSTEQSLYNYFAFTTYSIRVSSVTYFAAEVYHTGASIIKALQKCPTSLRTAAVENFERSLVWNPCGISLFGTFVIKRKFFVSIISFIFTTQIVLLQANNK